jgi:hypothetical protein
MRALIIISSLLLGFVFTAQSQKNYTLQFEDQGVKFYTKTGKSKRDDGGSDVAIFLKVVNDTDKDCTYYLGIDFYLNDKTTDSFSAKTKCLKAGRKAQGKVNGIYFQSDSLSKEQMQSADFEYALMDIELSFDEKCK